MNSITDTCKYEYQCFVTIIKVKVISGHPGERSNKKNRDMAQQFMFLGQIFAKNAKNDPQHFLKNQNRSKNKNRNIKGIWKIWLFSTCFMS